MAKKIKSKYTPMSVKELEKEVLLKKENLRKFRFGSSGGRTTNVKEAKNIKKDIARMYTELRIRVIHQAR